MARKMWTVLISLGTSKENIVKQYMHLNVTQLYKEKGTGLLHVIEGKKDHLYDMKYVVSVQIRKHRKGV